MNPKPGADGRQSQDTFSACQVDSRSLSLPLTLSLPPTLSLRLSPSLSLSLTLTLCPTVGELAESKDTFAACQVVRLALSRYLWLSLSLCMSGSLSLSLSLSFSLAKTFSACQVASLE